MYPLVSSDPEARNAHHPTTGNSMLRERFDSAVTLDQFTDQAKANQLIDQVKYEQVVSWLGDNPNILKEAEKHYVRTTLGVLIAVLKASGFALIACFGTGALIGTLLFTRRRAQQQEVGAFSDAGGMLRLNLDEMTPQTNPARLLGPQSRVGQ